MRTMTRGGRRYKKRDKDVRRRPEEGLTQTCEERPDKLSRYLRNDELVELYKTLAHLKVTLGKDLNELHPLFGGVILGKFELVKRFLGDASLLNSRGPGQLTPLMWAVKSGSPEMIDLLLKRGADVTLTDPEGNNAVLMAPQTHSWKQESFLDLWNGVKDIRELDVNHANALGVTVLHYACKKEWEVAVESLLEKGAHIDCVTKRGVTPLMLAGSENYGGVVGLLLRAGADVTKEDERGCTVLCYAIAYMVQKGKESPTIKALVQAFNEKQITIEGYLQRRMDLLLTSPVRVKRATETIVHILTTVVHFCMRHFHGGLETLLRLRLLGRLERATRANMADTQYCHALVGVMFEMARCCSCCCGHSGDAMVAELQMGQAFVESGAADVCLDILRTHGQQDELLCAALMPLFSVCGGSSSHAYHWLRTNAHELKPFHRRFQRLYLISCNICNMDERHLRLLRKRVKSFKRLMTSTKEHRSSPTGGGKPDKVHGPGAQGVDSPYPLPASQKEIEDQQLLREDLKEDLQEVQLSVLRTCSKKVRRKAAKALKLKLSKKRGQEMVEMNMRTVDSLLSELMNTSARQKTEQDKAGSLSVNGDSTSHSPGSVLSVGEESKCAEWVTLWDHRFPSASSSDDKHGTVVVESTFLYPQTNGNMNDDNTCLINNVSLDESVKESPIHRGNTIDLEENVCGDIDLYKSGSKNKCCLEFQFLGNKGQETIASSLSVQEACDSGEEHPGKAPEINASHFDSTFRVLLSKYSRMWQLEREHNYPGHRAQFHGKQNVNLQRLERILPELEQEYLQRLEARWKSLSSKLERIGPDRSQGVADRLSALLEDHSQRLDANLQGLMQKQPWPPAESEPQGVLLVDRSEPLDASLQALTHKRPWPADESDPQAALLEDHSPQLEATLQGLTHKRPWSAENSDQGLLDKRAKHDTGATFSAVVKRTKAGAEHRHHQTTRAASLPPPPGFPAQHAAHREENLLTAAQILTAEQRCEVPLAECRSEPGSNSTSLALRDTPSQKHSLFVLTSSGAIKRLELSSDQEGPVLVKRVVFTDTDLLRSCKEAVSSLASLRHQNIAHYTSYTEQKNTLLVATPLFECNLQEYLTALKRTVGLSKSAAVDIMRQIMSGLQYLHTSPEPVVHGNLKPSNVLITSKGVVKLADFWMNQVAHTVVRLQWSSALWWPAECHDSYRRSRTVQWTPEADVCAAGMLLHFAVTGGAHPFGDGLPAILRNISESRLLRRIADPEVQDLVAAMLQRDPRSRPTVVAASGHSVFWDEAKKWRLVLSCSGIISKCRHLPLSYVEDLHDFIDKKVPFTDWKQAVDGYFPDTESLQAIPNSVPGLLRFIRACVEKDRESSNSSFSLRKFFLSTFPTLPLLLYKLLEKTEWMNHYALENFKL